MTELRHAWLVDPFARTVTHVTLHSAVSSPEELHEIYALLDCTTIEAVNPVNAGGDLLFVDEDGKYRKPSEQAFFLCRLWPHEPLTGRALWVGRNDEGDIASPVSALDYVRAHIVWASKV
ncbi:DUF3846 domain-containing protein [Paraburkholderia sp. HD33-4]|uniref:DUF3846 domain-containing protein n=1 Tax=Paraburkholderia sp. HD33-4 TaxID=2883242 RepID=UPI001F4340BD|nr:hypothetical protein [Paraburkholderia sp. HD33-4]